MITLPKKPKVVEKKENFAIIEISELYPGYGITIGNALRRVLLSSLSGGAITQAKIKGAAHEFSALPGILEDTVLILMNLKKLNFAVYSDEPQTIILKSKGTGEIFGKDFKLTSELKLVNPDCHIATITKSTSDLEIEATVEKGIGYEPIERREKSKQEVGVFPLDALYGPVRRVNFKVQNMMVGKRTDYDKLSLEIETNGVLSPEECLDRAIALLLDHFSLLSESFSSEKQAPSSVEDKVKTTSLGEEDEKKKIKIEDLKMSERNKTILIDSGIKTVASLCKKSEQDLSYIKGFGDKAMEEAKKALKKLGLKLKES